VTMVDILDDLENASARVRDASFAISILGVFVVCCGILTLIGSVAMTKYARLYQAAILKTLGARKRIIVRSTLVEYGVLGVLAGTIGAAAAMVMTWVLSTYGTTPMPWWPRPWIVLAGLAGTTVLMMVAGVLSTWDVIMKKPLLIMREE
jgi:putative ABC transport system permease protein